MITFMRALVDDAREFLNAKIDAFKEEAELYGSGPTGYDVIENQIRDIKESYCYKMVEDGKIIGGMGIVDKGMGHYWICFMFVDLAHQNKGIGTLAIEFLETEFPQAHKWTLETPYLSYRNHHFYEKQGFVKVGETKPRPEKNGFFLFLYEKNSLK